ncbi:MAG: hypothetical protein OXG53_05055 [Chloroflexi bacterium]|nr:hypothetical protein [Chloroflexota bacterium]
MDLAITRIIVVTRNVQFAIDVKRALEALGEYSVTTVADVRNAIEQIRDHPQHLLLLDTAGLSLDPAMMIDVVRSRQEGIAIVLAPDSPAMRELARENRAQGLVDIPVMARDLIPILNAALLESDDVLQQTQETATVDVGEDTIYIESLFEDLLAEDLALNYTRRRLQASYELLNPRSDTKAADSTVQSAHEILVEPDDQSDTVRYRVVTIKDEGASATQQMTEADIDETPMSASARSETVRDLAYAITGEEGQSAEPPEVSVPDTEETALDDSASFENMLSAVLDESTQLENLTLESLFDTTRELPGALGTGVVPAWLRETEKFIREPGFLSEMAERLPPLEPEADVGETTIPSEGAPKDLTPEPSSPPADETEKSSAPPARPMEERPASPAADQSRTPLWSRNDDPLLAQLAVTMTQMMTNLTADATILTREDQIVAFSGEMPLDKFRLLRRMIADDWTAESSQSRIRFVKLPESGLDYMLYSRGSVADHTLTMVFAGARQLRDIRRQGDHMLQALDEAPGGDPQSAAIAEPPAPNVAVSRQPFAFVWLVDDPARLLRKRVAEQLVFWLEVQLNSMDWKIHRLDVHHDFIYLRADVPGSASPDALVRTVMDRARQIACSEDQALPRDLWADAYLVLQPGRDMSERELQRFLHFARA